MVLTIFRDGQTIYIKIIGLRGEAKSLKEAQGQKVKNEDSESTGRTDKDSRGKLVSGTRNSQRKRRYTDSERWKKIRAFAREGGVMISDNSKVLSDIFKCWINQS